MVMLDLKLVLRILKSVDEFIIVGAMFEQISHRLTVETVSVMRCGTNS